MDDKTPIENLVKHPVEALLALRQSQGCFANPKIVLPPHIYGKRKNSRGLNLNAQVQLQALMAQLETFRDKTWQAAPIIDTQVAERAKCLERVADLFEENMAELIVLCSREGNAIGVGAIPCGCP
ncbi:hypothetical protein PN36_34315 [Candidatus Thiomargarita nelsonii]|uniref:Uncharacterized protein n=1 Tax=Candidatus Thiomargarita nelsonii TaxID=1003181 RepID=A0A4E0QJM3_9GAMM|nr:hypothetical protein PN36_34315 [Candidatus Thiomargarita nelsonii]